MIVTWGFITGGGFFVSLGLAADAVWGEVLGPGTWSLVAWGIYACIAGFFLAHSRGPVVVAGTPYFRTRTFDRTVLAAHGAFTLAMLVFSHSFLWTIAFEVLWIALWVGALLGIMWTSSKPMALGLWMIGSVCRCNERDMILETVRSWEWWDGLPDMDKKALWDALPDWKWELYGYSLERKDNDVAARIVQWMELETHPYWYVAKTMHTGDTAASIRVFLQVRDGGQAAESYACEF